MSLREFTSEKLDGSEADQLKGRFLKGTVELFQSFAQGGPWILLVTVVAFHFGITDLLLSVGPVNFQSGSAGRITTISLIGLSIAYLEYQNLHCNYPGD